MSKRTVWPDGVDKVTGRAAYGADYTMPGMLYGKVLRTAMAVSVDGEIYQHVLLEPVGPDSEALSQRLKAAEPRRVTCNTYWSIRGKAL